jgi:hypothetical protein
MLQHVLRPNPVHMLPFSRQEERPKALHSVILETAAELITIEEIEGAEAFLAVAIELPLVMVPRILV